MVLYCSGKSKATVTILSPSKEVIVGDAAIDVNLTTQNQQDFVDRTYPMTAPIDETFSKAVVAVQTLSTEPWIGQQNPVSYAACPRLNIAANRVYSYFEERPEYYSDNSGTCSYRIFFSSSFNLEITDKNDNIIFNQSYIAEPKYTVVCSEECPKGYCKCDCIQYPGYCCYDSNGILLRN